MRGLLPGQQLVQMPDGKLQIFTNNLTAKVASSPQQVFLTVLLFIYACSIHDLLLINSVEYRCRRDIFWETYVWSSKFFTPYAILHVSVRYVTKCGIFAIKTYVGTDFQIHNVYSKAR